MPPYAPLPLRAWLLAPIVFFLSLLGLEQGLVYGAGILGVLI